MGIDKTGVIIKKMRKRICDINERLFRTVMHSRFLSHSRILCAFFAAYPNKPKFPSFRASFPRDRIIISGPIAKNDSRPSRTGTRHENRTQTR